MAETQRFLRAIRRSVDLGRRDARILAPMPDSNGPRTERVARALHAISLIDLTDLSDDHAVDGIDDLCTRAREHHTAAVCVWPEHVARCATLLADSGVRIATVVNFPSGDEDIGSVLEATMTALADGASDIDVVLPYRAFMAGEVQEVGELISSVGELIAPPNILKVILETSELDDAETIRSAAKLAVGVGADFIKTSTGKAAGGATLEAAVVMLDVIAAADRSVGLKPSGGIRTTDEAFAYLELAASAMGPEWATPETFRFGASGLLDALLATVAGDDAGPVSDSGY